MILYDILWSCTVWWPCHLSKINFNSWFLSLPYMWVPNHIYHQMKYGHVWSLAFLESCTSLSKIVFNSHFMCVSFSLFFFSRVHNHYQIGEACYHKTWMHRNHIVVSNCQSVCHDSKRVCHHVSVINHSSETLETACYQSISDFMCIFSQVVIQP